MSRPAASGPGCAAPPAAPEVSRGTVSGGPAAALAVSDRATRSRVSPTASTGHVSRVAVSRTTTRTAPKSWPGSRGSSNWSARSWLSRAETEAIRGCVLSGSTISMARRARASGPSSSKVALSYGSSCGSSRRLAFRSRKPQASYTPGGRDPSANAPPVSWTAV